MENVKQGKKLIITFFIFFVSIAKPAPLRNCTLRPYSSTPSQISSSTLNTSNITPYPYYVNNQITNGGQHSKDLNYITEYVKDKNLSSKDRKKLSQQNQQKQQPQQQQKQQHHYQEQTVLSKNFNQENAGSGKKFEHQHKNSTKSIHGKIARRKRNSIENEAKHANYNRRNFTKTQNQYHQLSASSRSNSQPINGIHTHQHTQQKQPLPYQYHQQRLPYSTSTFNVINNNINIHGNNLNSNNNNDLFTDTVEKPTLIELECVAGFDGGLPQYFFLEAYDSKTKKLRLNITSALNDIPLFRIDLAGNLPFFNNFFAVCLD